MSARFSTNGDTAFTADQLIRGRALTFKGAPEVLQLFRMLVDEWYSVGEVCNILRAQCVFVHRDTLRAGLDQMCAMGFLETRFPSKLGRAKMHYRRKLTDEQRQYRERERTKARNMNARAKVVNRIERREARTAPEKTLQDF